MDRGVFLKHIVEKKPFETYDLSRHKGANAIEKIKKNLRTLDQKAKALTLESRATSAGGTLIEFRDGKKRVLTPVECERLQGLPDNYTSQGKGAKIRFISNTQRYAACGNAFNVDVITHILSFIPAKYQK
jgi:site-specific DNA-cytosine methylase